MTTSESSPVSGFSLGRRSLLLGGASIATLTTLGHAGAAAASQPTPSKPDFDFDKDNFIRDLISTRADGAFPEETVIGPMDASIYIWITTLFQMSWFDALAPYHPTAVGIHSRIPRRPASESATNRNKNTAGLYASLRVLHGVFPERVPAMRAAFKALGLDPDNESEDQTSPIGIGNIAGKAVARARAHDGMNHLGDKGRKYNGKPYDDYTGYQPVNTPYKLVNPSRWQPAMGPHQRRVGGGPGDKGIWIIQRFVTPQMRLVKPYTYKNPGEFTMAPPNHTNHTDPRRYKRSVDEILEASAALNDERKVMCEWFDNKAAGIAMAVGAAARSHDLDLDGWCHLHMVTAVARFDDLIAAWHQKAKHDAVRPFSAIRHVYGSRRVTAWGGPGKGTVKDMPADEWASYLPVGDHPDYPSGSTTMCAAEAQATRRFLGDDVLDMTHVFPKGALLTEPGLVPAKDLKLHWRTWTDFEKDCAMSRVWGGVHFKKTVERSLEWGAQFGDRAYEFAQRHIKGDVEE
jgi:hypothetical protein